MGSGLSTGEVPGPGSQNRSKKKLAPVAGRRRGGNKRRSTRQSPGEIRTMNFRSEKDIFLGVEGDRMKTQSEVTTMKEFNKSSRELFRLIDLDLNGVLSFAEIQRCIENAVKNDGDDDERVKAKVRSLMAHLGLDTLSDITESIFVRQLLVAYQRDPGNTARATKKALRIMRSLSQKEKESKHPSMPMQNEEHGLKLTAGELEEFIDANGNPTNAFILEDLRSVKEAVGRTANVVRLETRATENADKEVHAFENTDSKEVRNNFTRAKFLFQKCEKKLSKSLKLEHVLNEQYDHLKFAVARVLGTTLVAGDKHYRDALEDLALGDKTSAEAFDELNQLAAEIGNVGPLCPGDEADVIRFGCLVPVKVTRDLGEKFEVSIFKRVEYPPDTPYEEGFETSEQELRQYRRIALYAHGCKNRQLILNYGASLRLGDEVQLSHNGEDVRAHVEQFDNKEDKVKLVIESFRATKSRTRVDVSRADIWFDASPNNKSTVSKKNNQDESTLQHLQVHHFATLVEDAKEGQKRLRVQDVQAGDTSRPPVTVTIGVDTHAERVKVVAFGSVVLQDPLRNNHPEVPGVMGAAAAGATRLDIDIYNGTKCIGDSIILGIGTPSEEQAVISGFESILLRDDLRKSHADTTAVTLVIEAKSRMFLTELYADAKATRTRMAKLGQYVEQRANKHSDIVEVVLPALKRMKRSLTKSEEKYQGDFDRLTDLARMTFACRNCECALAVLKLLRAHQGWEILRLKNRLMPEYDASASGGYRDILLNLRDRINGHIAEVQINLRPLLDLKKVGHQSYKIARLLGLNERRTTRFAGVPQGQTLDALGSGLTRNLEIYGLQMSPSQLAQLYSTRGLQSATCALQKLTMHSISSMNGWTVAQAVLKIGTNVSKSMLGLTLSNCGLQGPIPDALADAFPNLEELVLSHNAGIVGHIPANLAKIYSLKVLDLGGCSLDGTIPESLGNGLSKLKGLYVQDNNLGGAIPGNLAQLPRVDDMFLHNNNFSGPIPKTFERMPQLRRLVLSHNMLTGAIPKGLCRSPRLQMLFLDNNRLSGAVPNDVARHKTLKQVAFNNNRLDKLPALPGHKGPQQLSMSKPMLDTLTMRSHGYLASNTLYRREKLQAAGVTVSDLKERGLAATELSRLGFTLSELHNANFSARELRNACYSTKAMKAAGVSVTALLNDAKVSMSELLKFCNSAQDFAELKAAGFTLTQLKEEGLTLEQLKATGFTAEDFKEAHYTPKQLRLGGFTASQLTKAGYTLEQLKGAGFEVTDLKKNGFKLDQFKVAGFGAFELSKAGFTLGQLAEAGFGALDLKEGGFTLGRLKNAGFALKALKEARFCIMDLAEAGFTLKELKESGFTINQITVAAHFSVKQLQQAGFTLEELKDASHFNFSVDEFTEAGCTLEQLKEAHFTASQLKSAGFTVEQLRDVGFTVSELTEAGFTVAQLKTAMFTAAELKLAGFTFEELKAAEFKASSLKQAGFTLEKLKAAQFPLTQLKWADFTVKELKEAGYTLEELKTAQFTASELKFAGFAVGSLKVAGFTAEQLKEADCSAAELKQAGFTLMQLKAAHFTATDLKQAGFTREQLETAYFTASQLV